MNTVSFGSSVIVETTNRPVKDELMKLNQKYNDPKTSPIELDGFMPMGDKVPASILIVDGEEKNMMDTSKNLVDKVVDYMRKIPKEYSHSSEHNSTVMKAAALPRSIETIVRDTSEIIKVNTVEQLKNITMLKKYF